MKKLFILFLFLTTHWATAQLPNQEDIAKKGIGSFFKQLPFDLVHYSLDFLGMDDFDFLLSTQFERNIEGIPGPFQAFDSVQDRRNINKDSSFSFVNSGYDFREHLSETNFGLCSGVTTLLRKFNMLAFFDPENKMKAKIPSRSETPNLWVLYYRELLDKVFKLETVIIPGFENLYDLSTDYLLGSYVKVLVINQWVKNNIHINGLIQLHATVATMSEQELLDLHFDLDIRIHDLQYNPIIYAAKESDKMFSKNNWIHVVQATDISPIDENGIYTIDVWDINYLADTPESHGIITVNTRKKTIQWKGNHSGVYLLPQDDHAISIMTKNRLEWCNQSEKHLDICAFGMEFVD